MQTELILLLMEFDFLWSFFSGGTLILIIISWLLIYKRAGRTMTQRRYSAILMALGGLAAPFILLLPLGIMAVLHPDLIMAFVGFLIAEVPECFVAVPFYVLIAVLGGWAYARTYPIDEKWEKQSKSQPDPAERPASP